ncbi:protein of unknown function [Georgfuchsia toluolica]|uniref:Uncharacterized protein n=1 Tax=Georgfuchsia toluolica TaxID=424218 RepID=A0A916NI00_9PROT|nr:protein of unknown function [Georgfuchsia toluolica]
MAAEYTENAGMIVKPLESAAIGSSIGVAIVGAKCKSIYEKMLANRDSWQSAAVPILMIER